MTIPKIIFNISFLIIIIIELELYYYSSKTSNQDQRFKLATTNN